MYYSIVPTTTLEIIRPIIFQILIIQHKLFLVVKISLAGSVVLPVAENNKLYKLFLEI